MPGSRTCSVFVAAAALLAPVSPAARAASSIGELPLDERSLAEPAHWYQGAGEPGLFPGGANVATGAHLTYGLARLAAVVPRDGAGAPSADGWIGMVSVGMSNTNQEWSRFERLADGLAEHAGRVLLVDAAQGGVDAATMADPAHFYWTVFASRLASAGLDPDQVQVVWLKQSIAGGSTGVFPTQATTLYGHLAAIVANLRARLPQLQVVYFSSRVYGGWLANGEPLAFEGAFAVKMLLADQVDDLAAGSGTYASGPWLTWGPYLWADGVVPRADGLTWQMADFEPDLVHPALPGEIKVAALLRAFFSRNPAALPWYAPSQGPVVVVRDAVADAHVDTAQPAAAYGTAAMLQFRSTNRLLLRFDLSGLAGPVERAKLSLLADPAVGSGGGAGQVFAASEVAWSEATVTAATAPSASGPALGSWSGWSRGAAMSVDVTAAVQAALAAGETTLELVLTPSVAPAAVSAVVAREGGDAPRLVLSVDDGLVFRDGFEVASPGLWSDVATP